MAKVSIRGLKRPVFDTASQAASSRLGVQPEWLESTSSTHAQRFAESSRIWRPCGCDFTRGTAGMCSSQGSNSRTNTRSRRSSLEVTS
jgi:hypothetical protein